MNRDLLSKEMISQVRGEDEEKQTSGSYRAVTGRNPISRLLDYVSGVFTPILPAMIGAGMIKVIILVLMSFGLLLSDPQVYTILMAISDGIFYFLPIFVAASAARRLRSNVFVAAAIAASVFHPQLTSLLQSGEEVRFADLPVIDPQAASSIVLTLVVVWIASYVEKWLDRYTPYSLKLIVVPTLTLMITIPLMVFAFGPLWSYLGQHLSDGLGWLFDNAGIFTGLLLGGTMSLLIIAGMQYIMLPIMIGSLTTLGYDHLFPVVVAAAFAQAGATFGVCVKSKNAKVKTLAASTGLLAMLGIIEPAMYGVNIRFKKPLIAVMIGGAIGGACMCLFETELTAIGTSAGLLSLPLFSEPTLVYGIVGILISFVTAGVITYFMGFVDEKDEHSQVISTSDMNASPNSVVEKGPGS
ncbi:PTS system beta-glucoside-specific EIIBCA component [Paenibacillus polymyxa E681]|uniref:PTS transporter subunit EIIC n=1 Tax=Paenibacillus polymyxa TaxID=1406 RepID=UPI0001E3145B|nr:PTS transporter subunit EIIC [Paenibacillus polymyxa]ADM69136.1 PTS glucose transporter subunit IIABC [Paenibacillus polymyxa E681]QNV56143.1 PTS system beta-glucoside-specific EIIBCA component [Paenibacillus polymyxa E681]QNV60980.1 PTS system beta-glucoside-specific EIIBCA component [Paenibacillus polymyxa E681]